MLTDGFGFLKEILGTLKMASFVEIPEHSFSLNGETDEVGGRGVSLTMKCRREGVEIQKSSPERRGTSGTSVPEQAREEGIPEQHATSRSCTHWARLLR